MIHARRRLFFGLFSQPQRPLTERFRKALIPTSAGILLASFNPELARAESEANAKPVARNPSAIAAEELKKARTEPDGLSRWLAESRALFQLARASTDAAERDRLLLEGASLAERAREAAPRSPEAIELWVANAGTHASHHRSFSSLRLVPRLEEALLKLVEIDPNFDSAAGDRGLAGLYLHAPGIISVGSIRKARERAKAAFERFPDHPGNRLAWGEILLRDGKRSEAASQAKAVLQSDKLNDFPHDAKEWQKRAESILSQASG